MAKSQPYTWTNADNDFDFENPNNWNPMPLFGFPSAGDNVIFDGSVTTDNCIMPNDNTLNQISMIASYTGTLDASGINLSIVNLNLAGGTLLAPSGLLFSNHGTIQQSGSGVFVHNSGTVQHDIINSTVRNVNGSFNFGTYMMSAGGTTVNMNRIINFNGTSTCLNLSLMPSSYNLAVRGTMGVSGNLLLSSTSTSAAPNNTGTINFTGAGNHTITGTGSALQCPLGRLTFNTTGNLTMIGNITLAQNANGGIWTATALNGINANNSTVTFLNTSTVTAGNSSTTRACFDNISIPTGSTMILSGSSQINVTGNITNDGTLTSNTGLIRLTGGAQTLSGASTTTLNALEVVTGGNKTISSPLRILDSVKVGVGTLAAGGNVRLISTSSLKGRIAEITGGGSVSGNVTVETFALGGTTDWAVLGGCGVNGLTFNSWYGQIPMSIEGSATDQTSAGGNYFESVQGWNEADGYGYDTTIVVTSPITTGKGYWVYLGDALGSTGNITYNVTGSVVQGNVTIPLTNSAQTGFNLIANPYASPISWTRLRNGNASVANAIYIYNADIGTTTSFAGGVSSHGPGVGAQDDIPMGQGFYVQATANTNLTAQESNKVSNNTGSDPLLKTAKVNQSNIGEVFWLNFTGANDYDKTAIRFHSGASNLFDIEADAHKFYSSPGYIGYPGVWTKRTAIATKLGNEEYSINSVNPNTSSPIVMDVITRPYQSGMYTISAEGLENVTSQNCLMLRDKVTNTIHDLRSGDYTFNISDTTISARFELTVCGTNYVANVTSVNAENVVTIGQDKNAAYVNLSFPNVSDATISVTNILGRKVISDVKVRTEKETVKLDLPINNEVLFITVTTNENRITKKLVR